MFSFAIILKSSFFIILLIFYNSFNDLILGVIVGFDVYKSNVYDFDVYNPNIYDFSVWFIAINLLS